MTETFAQSPSFQKGNKNLDLGLALGIYTTEGKNLDLSRILLQAH